MKSTIGKHAVWIHGVVMIAAGALAAHGADAQLPTAVREQMEKQADSLQMVYIEWEQTTFRGNREIHATNNAYFEGNRFLINEGRDISFDGDVMWSVTIKPGRDGQPENEPHYTLRKVYVNNKAEKSTSLTDLYWNLSYFEAAGIFAPRYPGNLATFNGLRPVALRHAERNYFMEISPEDENFRMTSIVDDAVLLNFREMNPAMFQKELERSALPPERIAEEMKIVERARAAAPRRKVTMLLDGKHGFSPMEREDRTADGRLIARYKVEEWRHFEKPGVWLPLICSVSYFTNPGNFDQFSDEPVRRLRIVLKKAEFGPRPTQFALINSPKYKTGGTWVYDEAITETQTNGVKTPVILTVAADGTLLNAGSSMVQFSSRRLLWIGIVLCILAVPPIVFFAIRSKSKKE